MYKSSVQNINTNSTVQIFKNGTEITDTEGKIATGMEVHISLNNETFEYTIVVKGDTNGDGDFNIHDMLQVNKYRLNKAQLADEYLLAGDVTGDGKVDIYDILKMNKFRLKKINSL